MKARGNIWKSADSYGSYLKYMKLVQLGGSVYRVYGSSWKLPPKMAVDASLDGTA